MSMVDLKNRAVAELLERERRLKPEKRLENYEVAWIDIREDKGAGKCTAADKPSDCFVSSKDTDPKSPQTIKILLKEKSGNHFVTIYDQSAPQALLEKLQKPVEPTAEEVAIANLNQAGKELVEEEGYNFFDVAEAKVRVRQDIDCNCMPDTSVQAMKKAIELVLTFITH